jgi:hypothetical protein
MKILALAIRTGREVTRNKALYSILLAARTITYCRREAELRWVHAATW